MLKMTDAIFPCFGIFARKLRKYYGFDQVTSRKDP